MLNFRNLFLTFIGLVSANAVSAALTDGDGYPIVYLRGEVTPQAWSADDDYLFTRNGNTYTLILDRLEGQMKIADAEWSQFNYGANDGQEKISDFGVYDLKEKGGNFQVSHLEDVTISFTVAYEDGKWVAEKLSFSSDGTVIPQQNPWSGSLPVMYINVYKDEDHSSLDNEIISKDLAHKDYFSFAEYWLDLNGCEWLEELGAESVGSESDPLPLEIKARGNYTRTGFSKKPFKIKLGKKKKDLLGLTPEKSKHYALLAHADDFKGYLRNFTGFNLGKRIGLPWTPSQQPVELVINGDYRGLYFLTESIRIEEGRVDISELADNEIDPALISGGYLVELDNYDEDNQIRFKEKPSSNGDPWVRVTFDTPEVYSEIQQRFIKDQFEGINDAIGVGSDDVWRYLDLDDAVRYYIVKEIISDTESFHGSTYLFRDNGENQKWHFSPLWDCGNAFNGSTSQYLFNSGGYGNTWIHTLVRDSRFSDRVRDTWLWFMSNEFDGLYDDIDAYVGHISSAAKADRKRWKDAPMPSSGNATPVADNSDMKSRKDDVRHHLEEKIKWLSKEWGDYASTTFAEPQRDETPAMPLPDYAQSGIEIIDAEIDTEYFSLQGIRVSNPVKGNIYILKRGCRSEKVVY